MKKRILLLAFMFLFAMLIAACNTETVEPTETPVDTVIPTPTPTPTPEPVLTAITFAGLLDVSEEVEFGVEFNVLAGVTARGNNDVDYTSLITFSTTASVTAGLLNTTTPGNVAIRYQVTVGSVTAQRWRYLTILPPAPIEGEMLLNPDFSQGLAGWNDPSVIYIADGASMTLEVVEGVLVVDVVAGSNVWTPRFGQMNVPFEQGKTYEISFKAKSSVPKTINLQVGELLTMSPWFTDFKPGQDERPLIGTEWATYSYKFTMTLDNQRGGILFELGNVGARIDAVMHFDDILIVEAEPDATEYVFLDGWVENDLGTYAFTYNENNTVVDYIKDLGQHWVFMKREFAAADVKHFNTLTMTFTGAEGKSVLVKPNDSQPLEKVVTFGTEPVTITVIADTFTSVLIFAEGGTEDVSGQFTITKAELSYTVVVPVVPEWVGYNMTVVDTATNVTVTYADTPAEWWSNNAQLQVLNFNGNAEGVKFVFTGVLGHEYLFKIEGGGTAKEVPIIGDGTEQTVIIDLSEFTVVQRNGLNLIVFFVKTLDASGTIVINDFELVMPDPEWIGYGLTVVQTENDMTMTYANTPANWWENNAQLPVYNFEGTFEKVMFTFTGVATHDYLFKIEGGGIAKEAGLVSDGTEQTVILDLSEFTISQRNGLGLIVVFVRTEGASGSVVVKNWEYVVETPEWIGYGLTVVQTETDMTMTYANTPANWWENNAQLTVVGFDGTKEEIEFTFTGVAGHDYLFKIEGGGVNRELGMVADGTEQTLVLSLVTMTEAQRNGLNLIVVFVRTPGASGSVVIKNWKYVEGAAELPMWMGYGLTVVQTETDMTMTYADTPANWWENNAQLGVVGFDGTKEEIQFTFTGVAGHEYLFKIETMGGGPNRELGMVADGTEQTLVLSLVTLTEAQRNALNLIIVFVKTPGASGSVVVKNWEYVEGEAELPMWMGYGLTVDQTETNVSITYVNTPANWWENNAQLGVVGFDGTKTAIKFTFTGVSGQVYTFKIEGGGVNREVGITADGTEQMLTLDLSTLTEVQRNGLNLIVVFSSTPGASGTLVLNNWEYVTP